LRCRNALDGGFEPLVIEAAKHDRVVAEQWVEQGAESALPEVDAHDSDSGLLGRANRVGKPALGCAAESHRRSNARRYLLVRAALHHGERRLGKAVSVTDYVDRELIDRLDRRIAYHGHQCVMHPPG
jgi:hypothetical protein